MKQFSYTIKDALGIHARPAGMLVKTAKSFESTITIQNGKKSSDMKKLMTLMNMATKCKDTVIVTIEGADEETAAAALEAIFIENL